MKLINTVIDYFRSSKSEIEKVSWPSRQQTIRYSALVMGVSVLVAVFFASIDFGLGRLVDAMLVGRQSSVSQTPQPTPAPTITTEPVKTVPGLDVKTEDQTLNPTPTETPKP